MDLEVSVTDASLSPQLYAQLLGPAWERLAEPLRRARLEGQRLRLGGTFCVRRGESPLARLLARILRLPAAGEEVATTLTVSRTATGEKWMRSFAGAEMITTQTAAADDTMRERFGIIEIVCRLEANSDAIVYRQVGAALRLGVVRLPLPRRLWPVVEGIEKADGPATTRVSVRVSVPLAGHLISYNGGLTRDELE
jgi:hypothetical protein